MSDASVPTDPFEGQSDEFNESLLLASDPMALRRRRRRSLLFVLLGLVFVSLVGSFVVPTPYYLFSPGRLRPTADQIEIDGAQRYESEGEIFFTTVRLDQATVSDLVRGALDESVDIRTREEVAPGGDLKRSREQNRVRMDASKTLAQRVALEYLGYVVSDGVEVVGVQENGPSAGRLFAGDLITELDGVAVTGERELRNQLEQRRPGDRVLVMVSAADTAPAAGEAAAGLAPTPAPVRPAPTLVEVTLGELPDPNRPGATRAALGIVPVTHDLEELPIEVSIDSGEVGGPAAGLAVTLTMVDLLTEGDLTGDREVAVTGQINRDGTVGRIGGLVQKASAALRRGGVDVMLYPADSPTEEVEEVRRLVGDRFELHPVSTVDEAVEILNGASLRP